MKEYLRIAIICFLVVFSFAGSSAQQIVNINDISRGMPRTLGMVDQTKFSNAKRIRPFFYNPNLRNINNSNNGDILLLDLFDNKQYKAVVENVVTYSDGVRSITGKVLDEEGAYCYISTSSRGIYMQVDIPSKDEEYIVGAQNGETFLQQYKRSELEELEVPCGNDDIISSQERFQTERNEGQNIMPANIEESVTINVLIAYTPAAKKWADSNSQANGIDNVIASAMSIANNVMSNSKTGITFNLVHKYQTSYVETNSGSDLSRFRADKDGYMDEVHALRKQYRADLIILFCDISFVGGQAYLLKKAAGDPSGCSTSIVRVQQAATVSTVHEIGHNMGCHHHKFSEGPGLFSYSMGYRGVNDKNVRFSTVMPNPKGPDGLTYPRIPYFSSPDVIADGVPVGNAVDADNVLTLKKVKMVVSKYKDYFSPNTTLPPTISITSPANNTIVTTNSINVTTNPSASSGAAIAKVEFYLNNVLKDTRTTSPWISTLGTLQAGANAIVAKVHDNKGQISEAIINVTYSIPTTGGDNCNGVEAWDPKKAYYGGDKVVYKGYIYTASYWTQNNQPDQNYGTYGKPWLNDRVPCETASVNTPPTVSISSPSNGSSVSTNTINVTANAAATTSGASISKVEFYLNDALKATKTALPYTASLSTLNEGGNTIKVKAVDSRSQTAESSVSITYMVSNVPSKVENIHAINTTTNSIELAWNPSIGNLKNYEVYDGILNKLLAHTTNTKYLVSNLKPATTYKFYVKAYNPAGESSESDIYTTETKGNEVVATPPTISINNPANNTTVTSNSIAVNANASVTTTGSNITKVEFFLNGTLKQTVTASPYNTTINPLNSGSNVIKAKVYDSKGLTAESSVNVIYNAQVQNIPPIIHIISPVNNSSVPTSNINVELNASDPDGSLSKLEIYLNGALKSTSTSSISRISIGALKSGNNTIMVKVFDNKGATATTSINVYYILPSGADCMGVESWESFKIYNGGDKVKEGDVIYVANHWTKANRPSTNSGNGKPWLVVSKCDGSMDIDAFGETQICGGVKVLVWKNEITYEKSGTRVVYKNNIYESNYWTKGDIPSSGGPWKLTGPCK